VALHDGAAAALLLRGIGILALVDLTPNGRNHEVASVVAVADERERSLGHLDPGAIEILLQAGIELGQTAVLEVGDTLLLVLDITTGAKFVSRHGREIEFGAREKGGLFRREGEERQAGSKG
jgi:hypothetical protein